MGSETSSFIMACRRDPQTGITHVHLLRADTGEEVYLADGSYLLRVSIDTDADTSVVRCLIQHIASGEDASVQGNQKLREFVMRHILRKP